MSGCAFKIIGCLFDSRGRNIYHARPMNARPLIDSLSFARNGEEISGEFLIASLTRLHDSLTRKVGFIDFQVRGRQENNQCFFEVSINGTLYLCCQRCLGELNFPLSIHVQLPVLAANVLAELSDNIEFEDAIEARQQLDVLALIEDEILLALPFAPKHDEASCQSALSSLKQSVSPFAALAILKQ